MKGIVGVRLRKQPEFFQCQMSHPYGSGMGTDLENRILDLEARLSGLKKHDARKFLTMKQ